MLLLLSLPLLLHAMNPAQLIREFRKEKESTYMGLGRFKLGFIKLFAGDSLVGVKSVKILSLEECSDAIKQEFNSYENTISQKKYDVIIKSCDGDDLEYVLLKTKNNSIKEIVLLSFGSSPNLILVRGNLTKNHINHFINGED